MNCGRYKSQTQNKVTKSGSVIRFCGRAWQERSNGVLVMHLSGYKLDVASVSVADERAFKQQEV